MKIWRWVKWPLALVVALYIALVLWRVYAIGQEEATAKAVEAIHASRLTLADVKGEHLPPAPDAQANDATLAGIDANTNGIRDDVELAIFAKYPNDEKTRAALLQYAFELQMEFTKVNNSETLVAVMQEQNRGYLCFEFDSNIEETKALVFNNPVRKDFRESIREKYMTSYPLLSTESCDILF